MTEEFDDFEKRLRAALHAAADDIPISHDALERIRARTERRSLFPWTGLAWFRPVVAVGAAVLIAGSVLLGTPQLRNQVLPGSFVSASDTQRAEETPSQSPQAPADPEGVVPPPVHGAPSTLPSAAPEASPSAPEAEAPPTVFGSSACASPSPGERADSGAAADPRATERPCPSESPAVPDEPEPSPSPSEDDGSNGSSSPGPPGAEKTPTASPPPPSGGDPQ